MELGEPVDAELYRLARPSHRVIGPWEEAISRYVGRPLTFLWADESAVDRTPEGGTVSLVSAASLERLREEVGGVDALDGRRFRIALRGRRRIGPHAEDPSGWAPRCGSARRRSSSTATSAVAWSRLAIPTPA